MGSEVIRIAKTVPDRLPILLRCFSAFKKIPAGLRRIPILFYQCIEPGHIFIQPFLILRQVKTGLSEADGYFIEIHVFLLFLLCRGIQHVFDKYAVAGIRTVHKYMGHRAHQLAFLDNGTSGHE